MELDTELNIGTRPIKIHFTSNLPDGNSDTILTRDLFYEPQIKEKTDKSKTPEYPYFTDSVKYSLNKFTKYPRHKILETFFNKDTFKSNMNIGLDVQTPSSDIRHSNAKHNIMVMLQLLFPTSFPIKGNIHDTFEENIKKESTSVPVDLSVLPEFIRKLIGSEDTNQFSYIQRSSGQYTVMEVYLINDIINHPDYSKLFRELFKQSHFIEQQKKKHDNRMKVIQDEITKLYKTFYNDYTNTANNSIVEGIKAYSTNAANRSTKGVSPERVNDILSKLPDPSSAFKDIVMPWFELYKLKLDAAKYNSDPNIIPPMLLRSFKQTPQLLDLASEYEYLVASAEYANDFTKYEALMQKKTTNMEPWDLEVREKISKSNQKTNIIQILKQFTPPKRSCSNKELQTLLNHFFKSGIQNVKSQNFIKYVMELMRNGKSTTNQEGSLKELEIGVVANSDAITTNTDEKQSSKVPEDVFAETKKEFYEIYLRLNFIEGVLDKKTLPLIKCSYENSNLVRMYKHLKHPFIKKNPMLLYSIFPLIQLNTLMPKQQTRRHRRKMKGGYRPKGTTRRGKRRMSDGTPRKTPQRTPQMGGKTRKCKNKK